MLYRKGRILVHQLSQGAVQLFHISPGLRLNGNGHDGLIKIKGLEENGMFLIAQGISGHGVFEPYRSHDVAGARLLEPLPFVGVHAEQTGQTLVFLFGGIVHRAFGGEYAGVNTQKEKPPLFFIGQDFKHKCGKRAVFATGAFFRFVGGGINPPHRQYV